MPNLVRDGLEKGRHEGELHQARVWLLEAFAARFEDPPAAVRDAVAATSDLERLSQWLRAVVRAADATEVAAAVLGDH